eukprot:242365_1
MNESISQNNDETFQYHSIEVLVNTEIELATRTDNEEFKIEEQKYDHPQQDQKKDKISHHQNKKKIYDFIQPRTDDYIQCDGDISKCNAVQRVIHLLQYQKNNESTLRNDLAVETSFIYEYISSLNKYTVSIFMEDWYHTKTKHFKTEQAYEWFANIEQINCINNKYHNQTCPYIARYQRERGRGMYAMTPCIDHKNIILTDQLDSTHTFIFHSKSA